MTYRAPVEEMRHVLDAVVGAHRLAETGRFAEATPETVDAVLAEAARLAEDVLAPLRRAGDLEPARIENGIVRTTPGFTDAYRAVAEGGWVGIAAPPEHGGMGLPMTLATCLGEMFGSANLALSLCPLLTQGAIEALDHHASDAIKALYLPKLAAGTWTGTMNLTEPQAGSDVGAIRARAEARDDGTHAVTGQKSSSPGATTTSPRTSATSSSPASPTARPAPAASRSSSSRSSSPTPPATPAPATPSASSRSSTSSASTAARPA